MSGGTTQTIMSRHRIVSTILSGDDSRFARNQPSAPACIAGGGNGCGRCPADKNHGHVGDGRHAQRSTMAMVRP